MFTNQVSGWWTSFLTREQIYLKDKFPELKFLGFLKVCAFKIFVDITKLPSKRIAEGEKDYYVSCLLYTSDAADDPRVV